MNGENGSCRRDPVHARHRDVHDDQVGTQVARKLNRDVAVGRLLDNIGDLCEQNDDQRAKPSSSPTTSARMKPLCRPERARGSPVQPR
jgi:hypothetical protein